jgi:5'(3')-deoxyribonucleotidase
MMIDPRKIGFDIDGVVANTMQLFLDILLQVYGINHITLDDITRYELQACLDVDPQIISAINQSINEGSYAGRLEPMDGAVRVIKRLSAYGPIRLVTARPHPGPIAPWVKEVLPTDGSPVEVTATGGFESKADVLKANGIDYFVEDRLETCFLLQDYDITPILFVQPWNRQPHPFQEVADWEQLERLIDWE